MAGTGQKINPVPDADCADDSKFSFDFKQYNQKTSLNFMKFISSSETI